MVTGKRGVGNVARKRVSSKAVRLLAAMLLVVGLVGMGSGAYSSSESVPIVVDGQKLQATALLVDGVAYVPISALASLQGKAVSYSSQTGKVVAGSIASAPTKPILEIAAGQPQFQELVRSLGLGHRVCMSVPEKLDYYSCIILDGRNGCTPAVAKRLKDYLSRGGGVVMWGYTPVWLSGDNMARNFNNIPSIADWFGSSRVVRQKSKPTSEMICSSNRPFGTELKSGEVLFSYQGDDDMAMCTSHDSLSGIAAKWIASDWTKQEWSGAFLHPYGKGLVYWQTTVNQPNHPKLMTLFRGAIYRVATGRDLREGPTY